MAKQDKRVIAINQLRTVLPDANFSIELSSKDFSVILNSYQGAVSFLSAMYPEFKMLAGENFDIKYVFAGIATNKQLEKKCKIRVLSTLFQNYKEKK